MPFRKFKSFQLASNFYQSCAKLKMDQDLKRQLNRASSSIGLNIAESSGKRTLKDKRRFLYNAYGSAKECQSILILANIHDPKLIDLIDHISAILYNNIKRMGP